MNTTVYCIHKNGPFYEVWDNTADWIDTFDTEADALTCIASLEAADQRQREGAPQGPIFALD